MRNDRVVGPMIVDIGVLTHNAVTSLRLDLLEQTLVSIEKGFPQARRRCHNNDSDEGSSEAVFELTQRYGFQCIVAGGRPSNTTPGAGRLRQMSWREYEEADIVVFSDDDVAWREGAESRLREVWAHAPDDVLIVCGMLEPVFHWNTARETLQCGGERILVRDSCPGAAWSFRRRDWPRIKPHVVADFGYDYKACCALRESGLRVAQIDLSDHLGWEVSTHGNRAIEDARPLDRAKWGI